MMKPPYVGLQVWYHPVAGEFAGFVMGKQPLHSYVVAVHDDGLVNISGSDANGRPFACQGIPFRGAGQKVPAGHYVDEPGSRQAKPIPQSPANVVDTVLKTAKKGAKK